ncbi:dipeptidase [uncultured Sphingomonas sp.]|uniref:dipeptidase n=1 Tax=uncultured Sphingomonas sp. TaxID=158754 RepID=UPI0035C9FB3A
MSAGAALHRRLLTMDAHLDAPVHFGRPGWRFGDEHDLASDIAQLDLPRMEDGNLSGGFFVTYVEQGLLDAAGYAAALSAARARSDLIDATIAAYPDRIGLARTADDARRLHAAGRCIAFKSIENSSFVGDDVRCLAEFHARDIRMAGPVHAITNQLADSATGDARWGGLSPLGQDWLAEANRLGIVVDASHASDAAFDALLAGSKAPIILSHSGSRSAFDTPRNIDDDRLRALAAAGGVIGFATIFLCAMSVSPQRRALFRECGRVYELDTVAQRDLARRWRTLPEPMWGMDLDRCITALLHVIDVAGIDHVAFGADWDGGGGFPGLDDISALPRITERLLKAGLNEDDLAKLWSGNLLRLVGAVQARAGERGLT